MTIGTDQEALALFQNVAFLMGNGWRFNQLETMNYRIVLTNGRKKISVEYAKNNMFRICAYISKRHDLHGQINYCEITSINISRKKIERQIISDINKRLLAKVNIIIDEYLAREQKILQELDDKKIRFHLIEKILGENGSKSNFEQSKYYIKLDEVRGDLYFKRDFSVDINLSGLTFDQACNLLNYLKQMQS